MDDVAIARHLNREHRVPYGLALRMARVARSEAEGHGTQPWPAPVPRQVTDHMDAVRRMVRA